MDTSDAGLLIRRNKMIIRENKNQDMLKNALKLLNLTEKNQKLAERYLDLKVPEDPELLKEVERQDFARLDNSAKDGLYYGFIRKEREKNETLVGRFVRFVTEAGGTTARYVLSYHGYNGDFDFAERFVTPIQGAAIRAEYICRNSSSMKEPVFRFLIEMGKKDPAVLLEMLKLCYDEEACNAEMFFTAVYLHCVKPLNEEGGKSVVCIPAGDEDDRAESDPEILKERVKYLEDRLMGNVDKLFKSSHTPGEEDLERLKTFIREADPREAFPLEIRAILSGRERYDYQMKFQPGLAFLAVEHSNRFVNFIRLASEFDGDTIPNLPLDSCRDMGDVWFRNHIEELEKILTIPEEAYIRWAVWRGEKEILTRMAKKAPDTIRKITKKVPAEDYGYLIAQIEEGNPELYAELKDHLMEDFRRIAAHEATKDFRKEQDKAERYLLEELEIQDILPYVDEWREMYLYNYQRSLTLHSYTDYKLDKLLKRALVLECLRMESSYFGRFWLDEKLEESEPNAGYSRLRDPRQLGLLLDLMEEEQVPALLQMDFMAYVCNGKECAKVLAEKHPDWKETYIAASKRNLVETRILTARVMHEMGEPYRELLLDFASDGSKQVREHLTEIYAKHPEWESDILQLLKSKKGGMREMAVWVLKEWGIERYEEALTAAFEAEKTKKIKDLIQNLLHPDGKEAKEQTLEELMKDTLSGGRKRKLSWFLSGERTKVHKKDGTEASEDHLAALLIVYADMQKAGIQEDAKTLAAELNTAEVAAYVRELYDAWLLDGAQAKKKWVLYAAAIHGQEQIVPVLYAQLQEWAKNSRGALAADAVRALALNGTSTALLQVDQIARKFRFRQVKEAASGALTFAAEQLGITREELEDQIVPDLGFDKRMERIFDYGNRQFRIVLTPDLTLEVYDGKGKKLKNLPSPGKQDDPERSKASNEAWKLLKKQLKTVVSNQTIRLEQAMSLGRQWKTEQWRKLFVDNPVMHQFACGLIWGVYVDGVLTDTFRYMEDGTFNTVDEEEYELVAEGIIGLVHPIELSKELLEAWKEQLSDYEIVQPVEQLERPVFRASEEEKTATELSRFDGLTLNGLSLSGKLLNMGWERGEILDGGSFCEFNRMDNGVAVKIEFSGCCVGCENEEVTVGGVSFHKPGALRKVGNVYETERYLLGEVDSRYFSEIVLQVTKATASAK